MKRFLVALAVGLFVGACGGVMTGDEPSAEATPLGQTEQAYRCGFCGDNYCCPGVETSATCPADCGAPICGDGVCNTNTGENSTNCSADCGPAIVCGDGVCNGSETRYNCVADCANVPYCGDLICSPGESNLACPGDCPCVLGERCW
ncbi:tenascin-X [Pyxidicoccus parkwayensis]|uniref:Tenascin-X n=2 Tax=Pyxidicoccus parkwayensis TaxID=2813578 RepID=A0ABX7PDT0_9BACT|nr:tenascin-X [Pyxidicoccus parkwaysis]